MSDILPTSLDNEFDYRVVESEDATKPRIDVNIHETKVVIPKGSGIDPDELVEKNKEWIQEKRAKFEKYKEEAPDRDFKPGEEFPFLGENKEVEVRNSEEHRVEDKFILSSQRVDKNGIREELEKLYREEARSIFENKIEKYQERMDVSFNKIMIRNQRTRWASCSPKKNLSFNWRAIMAPEEIVKYIVVHELAHLHEDNHTKDFWRVVSDFDPDYKEHAKWLKNNSPQLIFTEEDL